MKTIIVILINTFTLALVLTACQDGSSSPQDASKASEAALKEITVIT